jgi:peptide/nickel transport system permease protein
MDRFAFVLRRPLQLIPVLIGISLVTFILVQLMPGDPVRVMLGPRATEEAIKVVRARYGLDQPVLLQYGYYILNVLRADFGQSLAFRAPVLDVISPASSRRSACCSTASSCPSPYRRPVDRGRAPPGGWVDQLVRLFCVAGLGLPSFGSASC